MYTDIYIMLFYIRYENKNNFSFGCNAGMNETKKSVFQSLFVNSQSTFGEILVHEMAPHFQEKR